jgi:hypothetical protein
VSVNGVPLGLRESSCECEGGVLLGLGQSTCEGVERPVRIGIVYMSTCRGCLVWAGGWDSTHVSV